MKNLLPPVAPNHKPLLKRAAKWLKVAIAEGDGNETMKVGAGYLEPKEVKAVAAEYLKRGWLVVGYTWVEAYNRHYGGHGAMKVKWVGENAGVKVNVRPRYTQEEVKDYNWR